MDKRSCVRSIPFTRLPKAELARESPLVTAAVVRGWITITTEGAIAQDFPVEADSQISTDSDPVMPKLSSLFALPLVTALATLYGCATVQPAHVPVFVTTYAVAKHPFLKDRVATAAGSGEVLEPSIDRLSVYPPMTVSQCNDDRTSCAWGVVKLTNHTVLQHADATSATVRIDLTYALGRSQEVGDAIMLTRVTIPMDIHALSGNAHVEKVVALPYGQMRRVSFAHGVDFDICVAPADQHGAPQNGPCGLESLAGRTTKQGKLPAL